MIPDTSRDIVYYLHISVGSSFVNYMKGLGREVFSCSKNGNPSYLLDLMPDGVPFGDSWIPYWFWPKYDQSVFFQRGGAELYCNEWGLPAEFEKVPGVRYVTTLRDPVFRSYSHYRELCAHGLSCDFSNFLKQNTFQASNFITRVLCGRKKGPLSEADFEHALSKLEQFDCVFQLERIGPDSRFVDFFGGGDFNLFRGGSSYGTKGFYELNPDIRDTVEELNAYDRRLYNHFYDGRLVHSEETSEALVKSEVIDIDRVSSSDCHHAVAQAALLRGDHKHARNYLDQVPAQSRGQLWGVLSHLVQAGGSVYEQLQMPSFYKSLTSSVKMSSDVLVHASRISGASGLNEDAKLYAMMAIMSDGGRFEHLKHAADLYSADGEHELAVWLMGRASILSIVSTGIVLRKLSSSWDAKVKPWNLCVDVWLSKKIM